MRTEKNKDDKRRTDMTTGRGVHGSKAQGGREFDRESSDHFERSEEREEIEEKIHASGQGTALGGGRGETRRHSEGSPHYSGSQQDRSEPGREESGREETKGRVL
jgi:hypothetical protein